VYDPKGDFGNDHGVSVTAFHFRERQEESSAPLEQQLVDCLADRSDEAMMKGLRRRTRMLSTNVVVAVVFEASNNDNNNNNNTNKRSVQQKTTSDLLCHPPMATDGGVVVGCK
jgi:hypothetical protein